MIKKVTIVSFVVLTTLGAIALIGFGALLISDCGGERVVPAQYCLSLQQYDLK